MSAFSREFFTFIEVAREKSIRGAAEKLNLSASALSRQMQMLEKAYGAPLLVRVPQGVQLTEQGEALLVQARKWLDDESGLRLAMARTAGRARGDLRLGIMECLTPFVVGGLVSSSVSLKVSIGNTETLVEQLCQNQIDALIAFNVPRMPALRIHAEQSYELGVVYAPALAPVGEAPYRLEDCLRWPLCLPDTSLSVWPRLDAEIYRVHAEPKIVLRTNSIALLTDAVAAGVGISFLTSLDAAAGVAAGRFSFGRLGNRRLAERLSLCTALTAPLNAAQTRLIAGFFRNLPTGPDGAAEAHSASDVPPG
ncbi:LysR family transcriptional regulator [Paracoccus aminophilus]|uniref:Transcriptional regulator, LysR family n=1 Tax=Paracoccus aminophilus JCM 7686 TaxID=1367847 RepID=S5YZX6_PARAH|nr:LysR family transcriptional regulator [Paracoccus aminophilus]AGT10761.1 transcriptional regulator, LysR family [Paracoccus aminophilus JCM 7686]